MNPLSLNAVSFIGYGLSRPECALAHESGLIFVPDWTDEGGVSTIFPDGTVKRHLARDGKQVRACIGADEPLRPNGICLLDGGAFLIAHLGAERGGVFRLDPDGSVSAVVTMVQGEGLPPTNFVTVDAMGRLWITVSTRKTPRALAYRDDVADGFVAVVEGGSARIVADNLGYTNECNLHPTGQALFVNETFARRLTSFDVGADAQLSNRRIIAEFAPGTFPDGLAFDEAGDAWITSIVSNRILKVDGEGTVSKLLEDVDAGHLEWVEEAFKAKTMGRPHLDRAAGRLLSNISNLAFCGPQLDRAVLGCLLGDRLAIIDMPSRGMKPVHWTFDIAPLITSLEDVDPVPLHP